MLTFGAAILPAVFVQYKFVPYIFDRFPFFCDELTKKIVQRKYTNIAAIQYRINLCLHFLYAITAIFVTLRAPGSQAHKSVATVIVLINCVILGLRWELEPDPVPILVLNRILDGTEGKEELEVVSDVIKN